jgi:succinate dehydrogenase / fumarate reductase cytochrome b subunit
MRIIFIKVLPVVDKKRPVNLDIGTIRLPITSYVSILHRVSGVIMFLAVGIFLWMLESSLASEQSFADLGQMLSNPICQFIIWGSLAALAYHAVAGIRHLIMDFGVGEDDFSSGRNSAWAAVVLAVVVIALITWWIL